MENRDLQNKCTILVNSCDAYSDLWAPFFVLFKKYWKNCPFKIVLNTETKKYEDFDLNIRSCNYHSNNKNVPYGKRIRKCLATIETPYVLLMLDDFFLREPVNQNRIEQILFYMDANSDVMCFNFDLQHDKYDLDDGRFPEFCKRSKYGEYKYNMQAGVWRTKDLYNAWKEKESPWQWELYGNVRSWTNKKIIYTLKPGIKPPLEYGYYPATWGVFRGKWVIEDVAPLFEKHGIQIDYSLRGVYRECTEISVPKHVICQKLYSYGLFRYIHFLFWYSKKRLMKILKRKDCGFSYSDDLNIREYGNCK